MSERSSANSQLDKLPMTKGEKIKRREDELEIALNSQRDPEVFSGMVVEREERLGKELAREIARSLISEKVRLARNLLEIEQVHTQPPPELKILDPLFP